jgi:flagellar basal-body rod protein FlgB
MLDTPTISVLETALDYASVRQDALADNLANVNTPGYQRKDASFAQVLAKAGGDDSAIPIAGLRDNARDFVIGTDPSSNNIDVETDGGGAMRLDGNNVDVDIEMGRVAKNDIYYQGLSDLIAGQFSTLKYVINSSK